MAIVFNPDPNFKMEWRDDAFLNFKRSTNKEASEFEKKLEKDPELSELTENFKFLKKAEVTMTGWEGLKTPDGNDLEFNDANREIVCNAFFAEKGNAEKWMKAINGPLDLGGPGTESLPKADGPPENAEPVKESVESKE